MEPVLPKQTSHVFHSYEMQLEACASITSIYSFLGANTFDYESNENCNRFYYALYQFICPHFSDDKTKLGA